MIHNIGQFKTRILRDAMHIASQFSDRARMHISATHIQIGASIDSAAAVWVNIPTTIFRQEHRENDPAFATDIGVDCEKLYRMLNAYDEAATLKFCLEDREGVGDLITISGPEGTLWTYQTSLDHIDKMPDMNKIRSTQPLPISCCSNSVFIRQCVQDLVQDLPDTGAAVSFVYEKGSGMFPAKLVSDECATNIVLSHPTFPEDGNSLKTLISLDLLQTAVAAPCIDGAIKFSFGDDTVLFMETKVHGCDVVVAIAQRREC